MKVKNFNKIISRNEIPFHTKRGCYVVNLDDSFGIGTHWVAMHISSKVIYYFDSYDLNPPQELINLSVKMKKQYIFNNTQYQHLYSVLCGYYCIYFINERHNGRSYYNVIKPFSIRDHEYNERFIVNYFKNM